MQIDADITDDRNLASQPPIDPIPIRPPGYFANCYSQAEIDEENPLAKASVVGAPKEQE